jgi:hypothetical protein
LNISEIKQLLKAAAQGVTMKKIKILNHEETIIGIIKEIDDDDHKTKINGINR